MAEYSNILPFVWGGNYLPLVNTYFKRTPQTITITRMSVENTSSNTEDITRFDFLQERADQFQSVADDARSLLRTNFLIIGFFLPIIGSLFSGQLSPEKVFNNAYTQVGLVVWVLSTLTFSFTYHRARVIAKTHFDPIEAEILGDIPEDERRYRIHDTIKKYSSSIDNLNLLISGCTLLTLIVTTLFALGMLLPYLAIIPQFSALIVVASVFSISVLAAAGYIFRGYIYSIDIFTTKNKNNWNDLTRPRQDLLKKIYVAVGTEPFQLSDLPLKHNKPRRSGTLPSTTIDESHPLLRNVSDNKISEYLLEQMVEQGYFEKTGDTDAPTIRPPHTYKEFKINEIKDEVETAIDRLGRELDSNVEAQSIAADELSLRPNEVLEELRTGDELEQIRRYNRVIDRLQNEDFELASHPFEFTSEVVTYIPTKSAEQAYENIEMEERTREYDLKMAEKREQARRAENTYRSEVIEPPNEYGEMNVLIYDRYAQNHKNKYLNIDEADVSEDERERLRELDSGEKIKLRIEHHPRDGEEYIASIGGP